MPRDLCHCLTVDEIHAQQRELIRLALLPYPDRLARFLAVCAREGVLPKVVPVAPAVERRHYGHCIFCGESVRLGNGARVVCPCRAVSMQARVQRATITRRAHMRSLEVQ